MRLYSEMATFLNVICSVTPHSVALPATLTVLSILTADGDPVPTSRRPIQSRAVVSLVPFPSSMSAPVAVPGALSLGEPIVKRTPRLGRVRGGWPSSRRVWACDRLCHVNKALARIRRYMSDSMMHQSTVDSRYNFEFIHRYEFSIIQSTKRPVYCFCNT